MYRSSTHRLARNSMSTVSDCDTLAVALEHVRRELPRHAGLIVCSAAADGDRGLLRIHVDPARTTRLEHLRVCAGDEVVDRVVDRRGGDGRRDGVGDHGRRGRDEVRGARQPECRLVGDVVANLFVLRGLRGHVGEALGLQHAGGEPPAERAEGDEHGRRERDQPHRPAAEALPACRHEGCILAA